MNRKQFNKQLSFIMSYAHKLYRESNVTSLSESLRLSWAIMRSNLYRRHTKIRGVSYHQNIVKSLLSLDVKDYQLDVVREYSNKYDPNAVAIVVNISVGEKCYKFKLGYLSKNIAAYISEILGEGGALHILHSCITGRDRPRCKLGVNLTYVISTTHR